MLTHYVSFVAQRALPEAAHQELWALWRAASIQLQLVDRGEGSGTHHAFVLHR